MDEKKEFYTVSEVMAMFGISRTTVLNHIKSGKLTARQRLNQNVVDPDKLTEWAKSQGLNTAKII